MVQAVHFDFCDSFLVFAERNERASEASERSVAEHLCYPACVLLVVSKFHTRTYVSKMSVKKVSVRKVSEKIFFLSVSSLVMYIVTWYLLPLVWYLLPLTL